jgi:hypothetical protein
MFPGPGDPLIWGNVPQRNKNFTGQRGIIDLLRQGIFSGGRGSAARPTGFWRRRQDGGGDRVCGPLPLRLQHGLVDPGRRPGPSPGYSHGMLN